MDTNVDPPDTQPMARMLARIAQGSLKRDVLRMLVRNFLCNVNDTRALIGLGEHLEGVTQGSTGGLVSIARPPQFDKSSLRSNRKI